MADCRDGFESHLVGYDLDELDTHAGSIYALDSDLTVVYYNEGYRSFARQNGAIRLIERRWGLGSNWLEALPGCLRTFYEDALRQCMSGGSVWEHEYECSSAETFRRFHQRAYPLGEQGGVLIVNSLVVETPHDPLLRRSHAPDSPSYADEHGFIHQCAHCRRISVPRDANRWDWIPAWVAKAPAPVSHGLCPVCLDYYYPAEASDEGEEVA